MALHGDVGDFSVAERTARSKIGMLWLNQRRLPASGGCTDFDSHDHLESDRNS